MVADKDIEGYNWRIAGFGYTYDGVQLKIPVFKLAQLGEADLTNYRKLWAFDVRIDDFRLRLPVRNIVRRPLGSTGSPIPNPQPQPQPGQKATRFDLDGVGLQEGNRAQAIEINIHLGAGLEFWPASELPAITAKTDAGAKRLVNLTVLSPQHARFWSLSEKGDQGAVVFDDFNIAVVATDSAEPEKFHLPIIIDPVIRNRNG